MKDPYKTLGVPHTASNDEIQKAYKQLVKKYHPDLHPDDPHAAKMMADVNEAYDAISKNTREAQYYRAGGTEEAAESARRQQQQQSPYNGYGWPFGGYSTGSTGSGSGTGSGTNGTGGYSTRGAHTNGSDPYYGDYDPFEEFDPFEWFTTYDQQQTGQHGRQNTTVFWPGNSCMGWIVAMILINLVLWFLPSMCTMCVRGFGG
mgnify:CR=1 FL=1